MSANLILSHPLSMSREEKVYLRRTLAAPGDELAAVLDELARHLEEFLGLVHCCWCWYVWYVCVFGVDCGEIGGFLVVGVVFRGN
jgi:hypothetical protein